MGGPQSAVPSRPLSPRGRLISPRRRPPSPRPSRAWPLPATPRNLCSDVAPRLMLPTSSRQWSPRRAPSPRPAWSARSEHEPAVFARSESEQIFRAQVLRINHLMRAVHDRQWRDFVRNRVGDAAAAALESQGFFRSRRSQKKASRRASPTRRSSPTSRPLSELELNRLNVDSHRLHASRQPL